MVLSVPLFGREGQTLAELVAHTGRKQGKVAFTLHTAGTTMTHAAGRNVLLVERFDRPGGGTRRSVLSGLTLLGLHELASRHGTYVDLAELIRLRFTDPNATPRELYTRIVVNVLVGNTDDHPRNVAAFWDGTNLELTPAYDICPQPRSTGETEQAIAYGPEGQRRARLADVAAAASTYRLKANDAADIIDRCRAIVEGEFEDVCTSLQVDELTKELLWQRGVANPSSFQPPSLHPSAPAGWGGAATLAEEILAEG